MRVGGERLVQVSQHLVEVRQGVAPVDGAVATLIGPGGGGGVVLGS